MDAAIEACVAKAVSSVDIAHLSEAVSQCVQSSPDLNAVFSTAIILSSAVLVIFTYINETYSYRWERALQKVDKIIAETAEVGDRIADDAVIIEILSKYDNFRLNLNNCTANKKPVWVHKMLFAVLFFVAIGYAFNVLSIVYYASFGSYCGGYAVTLMFMLVVIVFIVGLNLRARSRNLVGYEAKCREFHEFHNMQGKLLKVYAGALSKG